MNLSDLETQLNDFDPAVRTRALQSLAELVQTGTVTLPIVKEIVNLHCHTFFSFNAYGYSPSGLAWMARQHSFIAVGMIDFDVLDGVDEFFSACELLGVRGGASLETRTFLPEFSTYEINSPGEPGIYYHMGIGFTSSEAPAEVQPILDGLRQRATQRNREMLAKLNLFLAPIHVDYDHDVLVLTPNGNATERHMLTAMILAVENQAINPSSFWAEKLGMLETQVSTLMQDSARFQNQVRLKLMKHGGAGYVQPNPETFPTVDEVNHLTTVCQAIPCATWLDGGSFGEQAMPELLELLIGKGIAALNIIPDRNWNLTDLDVKRTKVNKLYEVVRLAGELDLPIIVGTEMNSPGQKMVDDFDAPELAPVRQVFLAGAYFLCGHTILQRVAGLGYQSSWAQAYFPSRHERNAFFIQVGQLFTPGDVAWNRLRQLTTEATPAEILGL